MKRFKMELSWLLVIALVLSSLTLGLGQLQTRAAIQATGQTIPYRVHCKTSAQTCAGGGTDSSFKLRIVFDDGENWYSEIIDDLSGVGMVAGEENNMYVTGPAKPIASTGLYQVNSSGGLWQWDWIYIYADFGVGDWVKISTTGFGQHDTTGGTINVPYDGVTMDTTYNHTLTFDGNGGMVGGSSTYEVNVIQNATLPASNFPGIDTRIGYTARPGWYADATGGPALIMPTTGPNENATYMAQWVINSYTITFDANGGQGGGAQIVNFGDMPPIPTVTRVNYRFVGWAPEVTVVAGDTTYVAQWAMLGDVNKNGEVTVDDALMILQESAGLVTLTDEQRMAADVSLDSNISVDDALRVLQYVSGLITVF